MDSTWNTDAGRSRFLAAASHDLLQPLHVARLLTGALRERPHDDRTQALLGQLDQALGAVDGLLLALLDLTRLDAGGTRAHPQPVNLGELMTGLVGPFQVLAAQRGLRLRLRPTRAQVVSDPALLRRILQNLVCNALRYTASGTVLMGCRHRGDKVVVEIWDTGVGIAEDQREVIFEEFHRGTNRPSEGPPGLGLGLAIVRRMARMLDHPIEMRSWPGRGSVFSLTLPIATQAMPRLPAPVVEPAGGSLNGRLVLCVDDNADVLTAMRTLLQGWSCEVMSTQDAARAGELVDERGRVPDFVLMDYHLRTEETNGVEVLQGLAQRFGRGFAGILITANQTAALRDSATALGFHVLRKPAKPAALRALLMQLAGREGAKGPRPLLELVG